MSLFGGDLDLALAAARNGEEPGFAELWRGLHPAVLRYLQAVVGEAAADVASETWREAAREVRGFGGDAAGFRVWLFRVARVRALEAARRERPAVDAAAGTAGDVVGAAGGAVGAEGGAVGVGTTVAEAPSSPIGAANARPNIPVGTGDGFGENGRTGSGVRAGTAPGPPATERALRLVAGLPREESEAVLLRVVAGLDVAQSAMVLGVRDEAARTAAVRGLRRLASIVEEAAVGGGAGGTGGVGGQRGWTAKGLEH